MLLEEQCGRSGFSHCYSKNGATRSCVFKWVFKHVFFVFNKFDMVESEPLCTEAFIYVIVSHEQVD
jgi:hypothetical protein